MGNLSTERDRIYKDLDTKDPKTATDRYYQQFDIIEEKHNGEMTTTAWDELDRWVANQSEYDQKWIEENTRLGALTPLVQDYREDQKLLEGYWQLEDDFLDYIRETEGPQKGAEIVARWQRYKDAPDHSKHIHGMEDISSALTDIRKAYRFQDGTLASIMAGKPGDLIKGKQVDIALAKWGYRGQPMSEEAREYMVEPMTPDFYNQPIGSTQTQPAAQPAAQPSGGSTFMQQLLGGTTPQPTTPAPAPAPAPSTGSANTFMEQLLAGAR